MKLSQNALIKSSLILLAFVLLSVFTVSYVVDGIENKVEAAEDNQTKKEKKEKKKEQKKKEVIHVKGIGKLTHFKEGRPYKKAIESGPIKYKIKSISIYKIKPAKANKVQFRGLEKPLMLIIDIKAKSISEDVITFAPDLATITTNNGQQIVPNKHFSTFLDSEFHGPVKQTATVVYLLENTEEPLEEIVMHVDASYKDEPWNVYGFKAKLTFAIENK